MASFQDSNGIITIANDAAELQIPRDLFLDWEPGYSLPNDAIVRRYSRSHHWLSDGSSQAIATDLPSEQIEGYISKLAEYQALMPSEDPDPLPIAEDWQQLTDRLRGSALWEKSFMAAMGSIAANAAMTLMLTSLTATHSIQDLHFAFITLRQVMIATPGLADFSEAELDFLRGLLEECGFDPAIVELP